MYPNQYYYHYAPQYNNNYNRLNDAQLVNDIQKAINGEYSAIVCYEKLAKMAPTEDEKNRILEIQKDEKRHLEEFSKIYTTLTGSKPSYQITEECPDDYRAGIEFAFKDEQETVDSYLDIADQANDPMIKERFRRAAADEQTHAVWFLFFFQKSPNITPIKKQTQNYDHQHTLHPSTFTSPQMFEKNLTPSIFNNFLGNFFTNPLGHINALSPLFEHNWLPLSNDESQLIVTNLEDNKIAYVARRQKELDNISMYETFLAYNVPNDFPTVFSQLYQDPSNHQNNMKYLP
ncbi:ferritin-like domain-containing protein [Lysinibacillus xylanilyticus]|uniref:ferritin-like domain-containing protein n=1 Tax=Lysinibacillus xylanilyticus TaxID=582475 RepID=UPI002B24E57D|nr:ferritin-like domain-containing protein [Lysinibacillus xylanilyticus]MEB2300352.1 ferritin-like domain-containing protein [Lysinibacillus xylanilyticus]